MRKGIFFIVSAPSGTGKTTLCRRVLDEVDNLRFTISTTTREKRPDEQDGVHYHFVAPETFKEMVQKNQFAEYANVYGNLYGTSLAELESNRDAGRDLLIEIDVQGAKRLKQLFPDSVLVFIHPPSFEELTKRLTDRGTDGDEVVKLRLSIASHELAEMEAYDYLIENRDLEEAVSAFKGVVVAERLRTHRVLPEIGDRFSAP